MLQGKLVECCGEFNKFGESFAFKNSRDGRNEVRRLFAHSSRSYNKDLSNRRVLMEFTIAKL
jgi:hypothetical protein